MGYSHLDGSHERRESIFLKIPRGMHILVIRHGRQIAAYD